MNILGVEIVCMMPTKDSPNTFTASFATKNAAPQRALHAADFRIRRDQLAGRNIQRWVELFCGSRVTAALSFTPSCASM